MAQNQYEERQLLRTASAKQGALVVSIVTLIEDLAKGASAARCKIGNHKNWKEEVASFDGTIGGNLLLKFA